MDTISTERIDRRIFIWRITALHTIAYFIAGFFSIAFMEYKQEFGAEVMKELLLPVDHWQVAIGMGLQPIRGIIIGLVLIPFREIILAPGGWIKLGFLILGLSYFSTIGPAVGSFDGYVFTHIPLRYHLGGIPETLLYTFLFTSLLPVWYKFPTRGVRFAIILFIGFILLMSLFGLLEGLGLINPE